MTNLMMEVSQSTSLIVGQSVAGSSTYEAVQGRDECLFAIQVRRLIYSYTERKNVVCVLNRLSMRVPLGQIYGLLGPSGCGKTTLIRCVLGILRPEAGEIRLFHRRVNSTNVRMPQIPGRDVGYMPQEYALYGSLTVLETVRFHRALHDRPVDPFAEFKLLDTMQLGPLSERRVDTLSGGQTRRLSFVCALVHKPRLLILDEPTVGVDPVLRERIWSVLSEYVSDARASVLITTHYIEETRRAQRVGFMRRGHLLTEESPDTLLKTYHANTLEEVFHKLSVKQKKQSKLWKRTSLKSAASFIRKRLDEQLAQLEQLEASEEFKSSTSSASSASIIARRPRPIDARKLNQERKAQVDQLLRIRRPGSFGRCWIWSRRLQVTAGRVMRQTLRAREALFAQFGLSLVSLLLFYFCIGGSPRNVRIAVVNQETDPQFSVEFLSHLNPQMIRTEPYLNLSSALDSVRSTRSWAVLHFPANFTKALTDRAFRQAETGHDEPDNELLTQSTIRLHADLTNRLLTALMSRSLEHSLFAFLNQMMPRLGLRAALLQPPIRLEQPIYGRAPDPEGNEPLDTLRDFGLSGILVILAYSMSFGLTVLALVDEHTGSLFERNYSAGVSPSVVISAHMLVRLILCAINAALMLFVALHLFADPAWSLPIWSSTAIGPAFSAFLLLLLQSSAGLSHGLLISAICPDLFMAAVLGNGVLLVVFILGGVLWPVLSLPPALRIVSRLLPPTQAAEALRSLLSRGLDIQKPLVYNGFIVSGVYSVSFFLLAAFLFRAQR